MIGLEISTNKIDNYKTYLGVNLQNTIYKTSINATNYNKIDKIYSCFIGLISPANIFANRYIITFLYLKSRYLKVDLLEPSDYALEAFKKQKTK